MKDNRWMPHATVATVIFDGERYLLTEEINRGASRVDYPTLFNQPAGHLEPNETLIEAALRETREECGWEVTLTGYLRLYTRAWKQTVYHSHAFIATPDHPVDTPLDEGIVAAHWLTWEEIQALDAKGKLRSPLVRMRIEDYQAGLCFPLDVLKELHPA